MDDNTINLDENLEHEIKEIKDLTVENNKMLHSIQRRAKLAIFGRVLYWLVIIGATLGAFYFIQPYIEQLNETYKGIKETQEKASGFADNFSLDSIKEYFTPDPNNL